MGTLCKNEPAGRITRRLHYHPPTLNQVYIQVARRLIQLNESTKTHRMVTKRAKKPLVGPSVVITHSPREVNSGPASPVGSSGMGYSRGRAQVGESSRRQRRRSCAVGRTEGNSSQHRTTNPHNLSENPSDVALSGFLGRSPFWTAITTAYWPR